MDESVREVKGYLLPVPLMKEALAKVMLSVCSICSLQYTEDITR